MVAHACNNRTWETDAERQVVQGQPLLHEFRVTLGFKA